jgi:hypothetical protein
MLAKLNKLTNWQAAIIIAAVGFAVFSTGLNNAFQGDDYDQIVNNVPIHSITNIRSFFEGGTFYNNAGTSSLTGAYYRPLMTTVFSLVYTLFGPHPIYFHLLQILLCIGSALLLYLIFKYFFGPILCIALALLFLVHPINSQVVYAIPSMQDALFLFFGMLGLWLLIKYKSVKILLLVALCLFLSLLSKETGILFVAISLLYILIWCKKLLLPSIGIFILPVMAWLLMKTDAIGLIAVNPANAPIDSLNLLSRLLTTPSIVMFYITKFLFPWKLASEYYWVYPKFSFSHFVLPLTFDLCVILLLSYLAFIIYRKSGRGGLDTYLFFTAWMIAGMATLLQVIPLDMTANEDWFYFSTAGFVGMIGVILVTFQRTIRPSWFIFATLIIVGTFGVRTAIRGYDWKSQQTLAFKNISASSDDFIAEKNVAIYYFNNGDYIRAKYFAQQSVNDYPNALSYNTLGQALSALGDYSGASDAFTTGMKFEKYYPLYENQAALTAGYGDPIKNKQFLLQAANLFHKDASIWFYLAILEYRGSDTVDAEYSISQARDYGAASEGYGPSDSDIGIIYDRIMSDSPLDVQFDSRP